MSPLLISLVSVLAGEYTLLMGDEQQAFWQRCFSETKPNYKKLSTNVTMPVVERFRRNNCRTVLDLGCGFGKWAVAFAEAGFDVCAVDISVPAITCVREWAAKEKLTIEIVASSAQEFVRLKAFDAIWCNSVLDHLPLEVTKLVLVNIELSLKEGGLAYLSFDGQDEGEEKDTIVLPDGTRKYMTGRNSGMLWRFYSDVEIKLLAGQMEILDFTTSLNGKRHVWLKKK